MPKVGCQQGPVIGEWRSLVARLVWDQKVGSSNLPSPTTLKMISAGKHGPVAQMDRASAF